MMAEIQRFRSKGELKTWEGMMEFVMKVGDGTSEEMETEIGEVWVKRLHRSFVVS